MAILQPKTVMFYIDKAGCAIPLYFKKVLIAVEWLGPRLGEHWLDHPGQF